MDTPKWSFSWHVMDAIKRAGFRNVDSSLLNCMHSVPVTELGTAELRLCQQNMRYCVACSLCVYIRHLGRVRAKGDGGSHPKLGHADGRARWVATG